MVRGDGNVVGLDSDPVQGLHAQHVAVGAVVGEDAGVGDPQPLEVVGDQRRRRRLQRQVEVDGVEVAPVEEVVALGAQHLAEVGAGDGDGDQREVVVLVDLDVELGALGQLEAGRRRGQRAAQLAEVERLADDLAVARRARRPRARGRRSASSRRAPPTGAGAAPPAAASLATVAGIQPSRKPVSWAPSSMLARWL